jgi:hypothetical protein
MPTLRLAPLTEYDLGPAGWNKLYELARKRRRHPREQVQHLILWALDRAIAGEDVELSQERLEALFSDDDELVA